MKVFALTVGKNEEHRYLEKMLQWTKSLVDEHFFYDDRSDDCTFDIATDYCRWITKRPHTVPSFMEHEGQFRAAAWAMFELVAEPQEGDWVLIIDCDEFFFPRRDIDQLKDTLKLLNRPVNVEIPEVFAVDEVGVPQVRIDGLWATIHAPRLFPWRPGGTYYTGQRMGTPAVPSYAMVPPWDSIDRLQILHFGYAREEDQLAKYERYTSTPEGHSSAHVQSIISPYKELVPFHEALMR